MTVLESKLLKKRYLLGALSGLVMILLISDIFVFSGVYGNLENQAHTAISTIAAIAVNALAAQLIVRCVNLPHRTYKAIKLIVDVLLVLYGFSMIVVLLSGFYMPFRATVYEGHSSLRYMIIIFYERLTDSRIFFFWLCLLSVVSEAEKLSLQDSIEFLAGAMITMALMCTMLVLVGQTSIWRLTDFYLIPHTFEIVLDGFLSCGILASGIWLLSKHLNNKLSNA